MSSQQFPPSDSSSDTSTAEYASDNEQLKDKTMKRSNKRSSSNTQSSAYLRPPTALVGVNNSMPSEAIAKLKSLTNGELRKGKWSTEEEEYTQCIIHAFQIGKFSFNIYLLHETLLPLTYERNRRLTFNTDIFATGLLPPEWGVMRGTTLRVFLAERLNCDAMRITKKFAGEEAIGKQVYRPRHYDIESTMCSKLSREIARLERAFLTKLQHVLLRRAQRKARSSKKRHVSQTLNSTFDQIHVPYKRTKKQSPANQKKQKAAPIKKERSSTLDETTLFLSFIEGLQN